MSARTRRGTCGRGCGPAAGRPWCWPPTWTRSSTTPWITGCAATGRGCAAPSVGDDSVGVAALSAVGTLLAAAAGHDAGVDRGHRGRGGPGEPARHHRGDQAGPGAAGRRGGHRGQLPGPRRDHRRRLGPLAGHGVGPGRARLGAVRRAERGARRRADGGRARRAAPPRRRDRARRQVRGQRRPVLRRRGGQRPGPAGGVPGRPAGVAGARRSRTWRRGRAVSSPLRRRGVTVEIEELGRRPAGELAPAHPLAAGRGRARCARPGCAPVFTARAPTRTRRTRPGCRRSRSGSPPAAASTPPDEWIDTAPLGTGLGCAADTITRWEGVARDQRLATASPCRESTRRPASWPWCAEIESLGFDHLWLTDSSLHARNCYVYLTLAAVNSSRLRLGTAVTNPVTRHPAITAAAAATLDERVGRAGRSSASAPGDRPLLALGRQPCSPADLADAIEAIRALWSGDEVTVTAPGFTLDHAQLRFGARPELPVFVSASGPRTLELAGGLADGVILLVGLFPDAVTWALEHIDRGARAAAGRGRTRRCSPTARSATTSRRRAGGGPVDRRLVPADRPASVHAGRAARGHRPGRPGQLRGRRVPGGARPRPGCCRTASSGRWRWPANAQEAAERIRGVLGAGVDSVHVFPLGTDRMATVRAFAGVMSVHAKTMPKPPEVTDDPPRLRRPAPATMSVPCSASSPSTGR